MCAMTQTVEIALVGAAAAIVGGLLSGAYEHWRDHFSRPKLQIDYKDTPANKVEIISEKIDGSIGRATSIVLPLRPFSQASSAGMRRRVGDGAIEHQWPPWLVQRALSGCPGPQRLARSSHCF